VVLEEFVECCDVSMSCCVNLSKGLRRSSVPVVEREMVSSSSS